MMVGNNAYRMAGLDAGSRESLTGGMLAVYVVQSEGKLALARLMWQIITGRAEEGDELEVHHVVAATVELRRHGTGGADGEVAAMTTATGSIGYGRGSCRCWHRLRRQEIATSLAPRGFLATRAARDRHVARSSRQGRNSGKAASGNAARNNKAKGVRILLTPFVFPAAELLAYGDWCGGDHDVSVVLSVLTPLPDAESVSG